MIVIKKIPLQDWWHDLTISLKLTRADCDVLSDHLLPVAVVACLAIVLWKGVTTFHQEKSPLVVIHTLVCLLAIGVTAMPLCSLTRSLQGHGFWGSKQIFTPLYRTLQPYRLINGYGLFRRMTGVGPSNGDGWAGQTPSVVKRPEIILEGVFEGNENEWTELSFRWKPGNVYGAPQQVAPHQPR